MRQYSNELEQAGLPSLVLTVAILLTTRACRLYRSVIEECRRCEGFGANLLARTLYETLIALRFVLNLTVTKETALAITAFGYAVLMGTEGVGLYLRKPWSRWFTIGATSSLIPIEIYEIVRELHVVRVLVLVVNVAIVVYLVRRRELFEEVTREVFERRRDAYQRLA